jgi:uncharacterized protein involved in cysteine biosynthesis
MPLPLYKVSSYALVFAVPNWPPRMNAFFIVTMSQKMLLLFCFLFSHVTNFLSRVSKGSKKVGTSEDSVTLSDLDFMTLKRGE